MLRIGDTVDLKKVVLLIKEILSKSLYHQILIVLSLICMFILWVFIFKLLKDYLIREILKRNLYEYNKTYLIALETGTQENTFYRKLYYWVMLHGVNVYIRRYILLPFGKLIKWFEKKHLPKFLGKPLLNFLEKTLNFFSDNNISTCRYFCLFILFLVFLYDCLCYNFVLYYTLMYLPIYMLLMIWFRISAYVGIDFGTSTSRIIFEVLYCKRWIQYLKFTEAETLYLIQYLKAGLRDNIHILLALGYDGSFETHPFVLCRRFILINHEEYGEVFYNEHLEIAIKKVDLDNAYFDLGIKKD